MFVVRPLRDLPGQLCQVSHWFGERFADLGCSGGVPLDLLSSDEIVPHLRVFLDFFYFYLICL